MLNIGEIVKGCESCPNSFVKGIKKAKIIYVSDNNPILAIKILEQDANLEKEKKQLEK